MWGRLTEPQRQDRSLNQCPLWEEPPELLGPACMQQVF